MTSTTRRVRKERTTRRTAILTLALGSTTLFAACAPPAAAPTVAPTVPPTKPAAAPTLAPQPTAPAAQKPPPAASPAPKPTQAPAKPQIAKITIVLPVTALVFAPIFLARARKFFEDEAIELDQQLLQTNALIMASLVSGESQFGCSGSNAQFEAHEKGLGLITVAGFPTAVTLEIPARNEFLKGRGATPQQPLKDKVMALKGAKIAVASLSGTPAQFARYALKTNGLDPDSDVEFIPMPSGPASLAALREGQIDAFVGSPPEPEIAELDGFGAVFIRLGEEVPALKSMVYEALYGRKDWIEQNAGITERVCRAVGRGNNLIMNDLPAAKEAIKGTFPQMNPQMLEVALDRMRPAFAADARMSEAMWKNAADVYLFAAAIKAAPSVAEGTLWTNKYLVNVPKR